MSSKTYVTDIERAPQSQIGATLDALSETIEARKSALDAEGSYSRQLLDGKLETLLKKISEEALETCLAAKECEILERFGHDTDNGDNGEGANTASETAISDIKTSASQCLDVSIDHMRYEAADVVYHLLVLLSRFGISIDEFAAELNCRMRDDERPEGCVLLHDEHVRRGK